MNNLLSALIAIGATGLLLVFREFVLTVGKKKTSSVRTPGGEEGFPGSGVQVKTRLHPVPASQIEGPIPAYSVITTLTITSLGSSYGARLAAGEG